METINSAEMIIIHYLKILFHKIKIRNQKLRKKRLKLIDKSEFEQLEKDCRKFVVQLGRSILLEPETWKQSEYTFDRNDGIELWLRDSAENTKIYKPEIALNESEAIYLYSIKNGNYKSHKIRTVYLEDIIPQK